MESIAGVGRNAKGTSSELIPKSCELTWGFQYLPLAAQMLKDLRAIEKEGSEWMIRIGVIGQSGEIPEATCKLAEEIGQEIASRGAILLTGGTNGVMGAVSRGAKQANGFVVGILPGDTLDNANDFIDIPITTGLSYDYRSLILVHSSDAIIMIAGANGTLGELSAAYLNRKPVVIVETSGGWAGKIRGMAYEGMYLDERKWVKLDYAGTAKEALDIVMSRIETCPPASPAL